MIFLIFLNETSEWFLLYWLYLVCFFKKTIFSENSKIVFNNYFQWFIIRSQHKLMNTFPITETKSFNTFKQCEIVMKCEPIRPNNKIIIWSGIKLVCFQVPLISDSCQVTFWAEVKIFAAYTLETDRIRFILLLAEVTFITFIFHIGNGLLFMRCLHELWSGSD